MLEMLELTKYLDKKADKIITIDSVYLLMIFNFDFKGYLVYEANLRKVQKGIEEFTEQDLQIKAKIESFVKVMIHKIKQELNKKFLERSMTSLVLILISFADLLPLSNGLFQQLIPLSLEIMSKGK